MSKRKKIKKKSQNSCGNENKVVSLQSISVFEALALHVIICKYVS